MSAFSSDGSHACAIVHLFEGVVDPPLQLLCAQSGETVDVPASFTIKMGGGSVRLYPLLSDPVLFCSLAPVLQKGILDVLHLVMIRGTYDVIRFQCCGPDLDDQVSRRPGLTRVLLSLLRHCQSQPASSSSGRGMPMVASVGVQKRIVHLLGLTSAAGISTSDLRDMLVLLRHPSELTLSLLQALSTMVRHDNAIVKAAPPSFFNLGGRGAGLESSRGPFPFPKEYQFFTWFRVENFDSSSSSSGAQRQHVVSILTPAGHGIDVFIRDQLVHVQLSFSRGQEQTIVLGDNILKRGVWYHFCMRHGRPRMALFSRDELIIHLDHQPVFQDNIRYPMQLSLLDDAAFAVGTNFDGQIAPVYFFAEALSPAIVETLARLDAGKPFDGLSNGLNNVIVDLLPSLTTPDRKTTQIYSRVTLSFHPARCTGPAVLDIFSNRHATLGAVTQAWNITSARDVLNSIGGISCLLPMFPRLLVDVDAGPSQAASSSSSPSSPDGQQRTSPSAARSGSGSPTALPLPSPGAGLGTSWGDAPDTEALQLLEPSPRAYLLADMDETKHDSCVGLLLTILARCITNHRIYQTELLNMSGIEMIEYALTCVPAEVMQLEGEGCILALTLLRSVVSGCLPLETRVTKRLVCNFAIWSRCRYSLQSSLMKVILADIRKQPAHFLSVVGVYGLMESMQSCYADIDSGVAAVDVVDESPLRSDDAPRPAEQGGRLSSSSSSPLLPEFAALLSVSTPSSAADAAPPVVSQRAATNDSPRSPVTPANRTGQSTSGSVTSSGTVAGAGNSHSHNKKTTFKSSLQKATREPGANPVDAPTCSIVDVIPDPIDAEEDDDRPEKQDATDPSMLAIEGRRLDEVQLFGAASLREQRLDSPRHASEDSPLRQVEPSASIDATDPGRSARHQELLVLNYQRKRLRVCLQAMVMTLVAHSGHAREIQPLIDLMATCKDLQLVNEVAQMLLCLLVEGGAKIISAITETCHGAEEFASFALRYLVHRPREELRCSGIRLITHYYLRVDLLPVSLVTLTLKRRKGGIFRRTMDQVALLSGAQGLQRLSICGGFALLAEVVHCHRRSSGFDTYTALLEMLLTKPGAKSQVTVQYNSLFEEADTPVLSARARDGLSRDGEAGTSMTVGPRTVVFAAHYISPDQVFDESLAVLNTAVLPVFFNLLPKLRLGLAQEQVFTDMLGLLKNSTGNREAFLQCPGWHLCVYLLVSRLMQEQRDSTAVLVESADIMTELEEAAGGVEQSTRPAGADKAPRADSASKLSISIPPLDSATAREPLSSAAQAASECDLDLWFTLGMKVYSTLLLHAVDRRPGGWREVMRTLSLSFDSLAGSGSPQSSSSVHTDEFGAPLPSAAARTKPRDVGMSFSHTVLSHLLNELTFLMQYKYKDLQRLARSSSAQEKEEANENLKNLLSALIVTTQHALLEPAAVLGLRGLRIAQLRVQYLADIIQQERDGFREVPSPLPSQKDGTSPTGQAPATPARAPQEQPSMPRNVLGDCQSPDEEYLAELAEETLQRRVRQWQWRRRHGAGGSSGQKDLNGAMQDTKGGGEKEGEDDLEREEDGEPLHHHLAEYTETYDFSHAWVHLGLQEKSERPADASFSSSSSQHSSYSQQGESQRRRRFAASERLQPLERSDTKQAGGLVLVLQILRFFDSVFLPNEMGHMRNVPMLDFYKPPESVQEEPVSRPVTIFSSAMRLSLFVLQSLSPLTDLATLNVRRMTALLATLDRVSPYTTPVYDWMLAAVVHATFALQRASLSLMPAFRLLGITAPMTIFTTGLSDSSKEDSEEQRVVDEEEAFDRAMDDLETLTRVYALFSTVPGAHLLAHIRGCLLLLADLTDRNKAVLGGMMDETEFGVLCALAERVRTELGEQRDRLDASFLSTVDSMASAGPDGSTVPAPNAKAPSSSSVSGSSNNNNANNNASNNASNNPERVRSLSEMSLQSMASGQSDKSEPAWGEAVEDDARDRTFSNISHASAGAGPADGHGPRFDLAASRDCLRALRLLRDTYFHTDLLRVVGVVQALSNLELLETVSAQQHIQELSVFSDSLQAQRDFGRGMVEEMTELNNLSASVLKIMLYREQTRAAAKRTEEALTLKNVAVQWEDCMRIFEMDWSPWCATSSWDQRAQGERAAEGHFELSKHKDSLMRRMLLTRSPEPIDHSDAAYLEGKQRDQMLFELGLPLNSVLPGDAAAGTPDQHFSSILKNDLVRPPHNKADLWGEEEEDGDDEVLPGGKGQHLNQLNIFGNASEKRPQWTYAFNWHSDERALLQLEASQITIEKVLFGVLLLTNKFLYFHPRKQTGGLAQESKSYQDQRWHLDRLVEAYGRRYLLQNCAIELLFADAPEVFLAFASLPELKTFFRTIRRQHVPLLTSPGYLKPRDLIARSPYTDMWRRRLISNFEYLMRLNLLAGRSYNDITQYPVFPWIIADYKSATLDLTNPATFRDLSKPMGALTPGRLREIMDRYNGMDPEERFMYGSHYSSAGVVLHYMIRQEPFTTLAVNLQGGRFDCPDRVFFDIRHTWAGVTSSMSDVKELIPELFCCPEALLNTNRLPLGCLQDGGVVGDVVLPPWARDAFEFVRLNREALESDYVSDHLHEWIDLIFGYKQRGEEAIKAHNLFYYLTYENAIDIEAIEDPLQREAAKAQVTHFGQTPSQLLTTPHVRRLPREECMVPLCSDLSSLSNLVSFTPLKQLGYDGQHGPVISLRCSADKLIAVHADLTVAYYRWHSFPDGEGTPFTLRMERSRRLPSAALSASVGARGGAEQALGMGGAKPRGRGDGGDGGVQAGVRSLLSFTSSLFSRIGGQGGGLAAAADSAAISDEGAKPEDAAEATPAAVASSDIPSAPVAPAPIFSSSPAPVCLFDDGVSFLEVDARHVAIGLGDSGLAAIGGAGGRVVSCGYWDHTLKAHGLDSLRELASSSGGHVGPITCVELGHGTQTIISGGRDGTLRVWVLDGLKDGGAAAFAADGAAGSAGAAEGVAESSLTCVQSLWGHHSPVQCLSYAPELDLVLSGSQDGLLCLHTVRKGRFVRSVHAMAGKRVDLVLASSPGYLLAHSWADHSLHLFWINGEALVTVDMGVR